MLYDLIMHHGLAYAFLLNLFRYITFRAVAACFTAFFLSIWLGPYIIAKLHQIPGTAFERKSRNSYYGRNFNFIHFINFNAFMG